MPCFFQLPRRFRPSEFSRFPPCVLSPFSAVLSRSDFRPVIYTSSPRRTLTGLFSSNYGHTVWPSRLLLSVLPPSRPKIPPHRSATHRPALCFFLICVLSLFFCDLSRSEFYPITCSPSAFQALQGPFLSKYGHILCAAHILLSHSHKRRPPRIYPDGLTVTLFPCPPCPPAAPERICSAPVSDPHCPWGCSA